MDNIMYICPVCGHGHDVGKSCAHCMTKTELTLILMLTLILTLTVTLLTLLTLLPPGQSWVCSNLGPLLRGLPNRHPN